MDLRARPYRYRGPTRAPLQARRRRGSYLTALLMLAGVCAVAAFFSGRPKPTDSARNTYTDVRVVDGDSLRIGEERIRLAGIDAPESAQTCRDGRNREWACGGAAAARLTELIGRGPVTCTPKGKDRYGRTLAVCAAGAVGDLGHTLVREGYAVNYSFDDEGYAAAEEEARIAGRGLWRGAFERPQDWRRRHARTG